MESYADALYAVKRGFLIVGLTGFTGSGCSTAARILTRKDKPEIPFPYRATFTRNEGTLGERRYRRLVSVWETLNWSPFVSIEVAPVIFAFAARQALRRKSRDKALINIRNVVLADKLKLSGLRFLTGTAPRKEKEFAELLTAYRTCWRLYPVYTGGQTLHEFVELMQTFGDKIRA